MDDTEFERLLNQKYAQVVLQTLLEAEGHSYAFSSLREEVNTRVADDSRGAKETVREGDYSPASLSSLLSDAKDAGIVDKYLNKDGNIRWQLCTSQLSQSQMDEIRSRNSADVAHTDTSSLDIYRQQHTDSSFP